MCKSMNQAALISESLLTKRDYTPIRGLPVTCQVWFPVKAIYMLHTLAVLGRPVDLSGMQKEI